MAYYVNKNQLKRMIQESQAKDHLSDELINLIGRIASGVLARYRFGLDVDDVTQDVLMVLCTHLHSIDLRKNVFSYLTAITMNACRQLHRSRSNFLQLKENLRQHKRHRGDLE